MIGIIFALLAAAIFGLANILITKGLNELDSFSATLAVTLIGNLILWPIAFIFTNFQSMDTWSLILFIIAGILAPGLSRILFYKGIEVLGVSVTTAINAINPLYSTILAVFFLNESLLIGNWIGVISIVIGVMGIELYEKKGKEHSKSRILKKGLIFPLLAGSVVATGAIFRKQAIIIFNNPILGAAISHLVSLPLQLGIVAFSSQSNTLSLLKKGLRRFWISGVCAAFAWILIFYAFSLDKVYVVTPLLQTLPLFSLFFAYIYLKEQEKITLRIVLSTFLIVIGVILVSF
jgi:uncharacterized membrane protein